MKLKNLIAPGSLKNLQSSPIVTNYALYNNFFYTQLVSFFVPQKNVITFTMILKLFFFFFSIKISRSFSDFFWLLSLSSSERF